MHSLSTHLALALALAVSARGLPSRGVTNDVILPTATNSYGAVPTGSGGQTLPAECDAFKPYVPEIVLEAVCSLHMTPGAVPTLNSACFGGGGAQPTIHHPIPQNTYSAAATTWGGDEGEDYTTQHHGGGQATATQSGGDQYPTQTVESGGYQQPTVTSQGGGYGQSTATPSAGGYES